MAHLIRTFSRIEKCATFGKARTNQQASMRECKLDASIAESVEKHKHTYPCEIGVQSVNTQSSWLDVATLFPVRAYPPS